MQVGMMATLLVAMPVNFATELGLFTAIILVHNAFGATQDVAIDALAVNVLPEHERGSPTASCSPAPPSARRSAARACCS